MVEVYQSVRLRCAACHELMMNAAGGGGEWKREWKGEARQLPERRHGDGQEGDGGWGGGEWEISPTEERPVVRGRLRRQRL